MYEGGRLEECDGLRCSCQQHGNAMPDMIQTSGQTSSQKSEDLPSPRTTLDIFLYAGSRSLRPVRFIENHFPEPFGPGTLIYCIANFVVGHHENVYLAGTHRQMENLLSTVTNSWLFVRGHLVD